jgi:hypothetical protein
MTEGDQPSEQSQPPVPPAVPQKTIDELLAEVESAVAEQGRAQPIEELPAEHQIRLREQEQDVGLKKLYAWGLLIMMYAQLLIADGVFVAYAWEGKNWKVPTEAMHVWLAATLVEIIGVVFVVTRYLFPRRDVASDDEG